MCLSKKELQSSLKAAEAGPGPQSARFAKRLVKTLAMEPGKREQTPVAVYVEGGKKLPFPKTAGNGVVSQGTRSEATWGARVRK